MVIPTKKRVAEANKVKSPKEIYSLLIDGNNLLKISLVKKEVNSDGYDYGAVINFFTMLGRILSKKDFNYCTVCWDGPNSGILRYNIYKDYKANRGKRYDLYETATAYDKSISDFVKRTLAYSKAKKSGKQTVREETEDESFDRQKYVIQTILEELCIRQYEFDDVEGDDLVSYYTKVKDENEKVVVVSSDKDLTQLINDKVIIYNPRSKDFITKENAVKVLGIRHDNIVLEKVLCGDNSDNIKGIKGVGETSLVKAFPELMERPLDIDYIIGRSKEILEERKAAKKKPLLMLENIVNRVTDGIQGGDIYDVNSKIIDLSVPLLTEEAFETLKESMYAPIDTTERNVKNIYEIVRDEKIESLYDENKFSEVFSPYSRIIMMENKRFSEYNNKKK